MSSPEPDIHIWTDHSISDVTRLPPPRALFKTRIPSPIPEQAQNKDNINLNYGHLQRWVKVKRSGSRRQVKTKEDTLGACSFCKQFILINILATKFTRTI
ncbi:hypothetical protein NQ317_008676 [Molorchus minor]|uniref:Uncharacterized protein n=1 Tax=Molorchus minor TaxID=1323400 RepID=A0ABQ9K1S9_9CUCU|nr:hypothetical protein NQ317_008676 [Molorchus minor]